MEEKVKLTYDKAKDRISLYLKVGDKTPAIWKQMAKVTGKDDDLAGNVVLSNQLILLMRRGMLYLKKFLLQG